MTEPNEKQHERMPQGERNPGASFQQKIRNLAKATGEDGALLLLRYIGERFLYRLSQSPYKNRFVLRGATLFSIWNQSLASIASEMSDEDSAIEIALSPVVHRPTRDVDLLAFGDPSVEAMRSLLLAICAQPVAEDGVIFLPETLVLDERSEGRVYQGLHIEILAALGTARPRLDIDVAFGETITPAPEMVTVPVLLDVLPSPSLRAYPQNTVIAEKCEAMVQLGIGNTRMKDFYDLWFLSREFAFDGTTLSEALHATFTRRGTAFPVDGLPLAFREEFANDIAKRQQWDAFIGKMQRSRAKSKTNPGETALNSFPSVIATLRMFLQPVLASLAQDGPFRSAWSPGGPWHNETDGI